jgi:F5/8 type C domain-containing protein
MQKTVGPWHSAARVAVASACIYVGLAAVTTWPLVRDMRTAIAGDRADPVLNASILVWNARVTPLSAAWWNPPHFFPSDGVIAFTESLIGISPVASPIYRASGNALLSYNLSLFLTFPLSAMAAYLIVRFLTKSDSAAFLAGLSFGFSPYRVVALPHLQTLATFGVGFALLGMHGYIQSRRWPWLMVFGLGWLQQSFANGYYILYAGVMLGLWLLYFCSPRAQWKPGVVLALTWIVFSLPLIPMLLGFRAVHERYGLHRTYFEIQYFSALTRSWFETHDDVWLWHRVFPSGKDNMFPGSTAVALSAVAAVWLLIRRETDASRSRQRLRGWLAAGCGIGALAITVNLVFGRIETTVAGLPFKMTDISRAVVVLLVCGIPLIWLTPRTRAAVERRSPLLFYVAATLVIAMLSCGPELLAGDEVIWKPTPYGWLMALPGFNEVRVPTQFKMIDILCLAVAAGLSFEIVRPRARLAATLLWLLLAAGLLLDGWPSRSPMVTPPDLWTSVEPADRREPILELPIGLVDYDATFRAASHGRHTFNGASGYDPPHYTALKEGLEAHDPAVLGAIASLGPYDIVVDGDRDPSGVEARFAETAPGAVVVKTNGSRRLLHVPQSPAPSPLGAAWPIRNVTVAHHEEWKALMIDGRPDTGWADLPTNPDAWVLADLGDVREIAGVTELVGDYPADFPRRLVIELSTDATVFEKAWEGPTFAHAFLGFVRAPRSAALEIRFTPHLARYVRFRETERPTNWRIQDLLIHAP